MKLSLQFFAIILIALSLLACGESKPTFDASSGETLHNSFQVMSENMSSVDKNKIDNDIRQYAKMMLSANGNSDLSQDEVEAIFLATLDGKTIDEFYEIFDELKSKLPTLDMSSEKAIGESLAIMKTGLSQEKQDKLVKSLQRILMLNAMANLDKGKDEREAIAKAKLHGKTADEVFELAASMRQ